MGGRDAAAIRDAWRHGKRLRAAGGGGVAQARAAAPRAADGGGVAQAHGVARRAAGDEGQS